MLLVVIAAAALAAGCGRKNVRSRPPAGETEIAAEPEVRVSTEPDGEEIYARGSYSVSQDLKPVYFDYDRAGLTEGSRRTLQSNAEFIKSSGAAGIQVTGHCDERGTTQYNLALGQARAGAVREYYRYLGVNPGIISVISYGEEMPACAEHNDDCWARNRRSETLLKKK